MSDVFVSLNASYSPKNTASVWSYNCYSVNISTCCFYKNIFLSDCMLIISELSWTAHGHVTRRGRKKSPSCCGFVPHRLRSSINCDQSLAGHSPSDGWPEGTHTKQTSQSQQVHHQTDLFLISVTAAVVIRSLDTPTGCSFCSLCVCCLIIVLLEITEEQ